MTDDRQLAHGIDLITLQGFSEHAAETPEGVQFGLGAPSNYEGTRAHNVEKIDSCDLGVGTIARETRECTYGGWKGALENWSLATSIDTIKVFTHDGRMDN